MKVKELINYLSKCDGELEIGIYYESAIRGDVDALYIAKLDETIGIGLVIHADGASTIPSDIKNIIYKSFE
jgi:hypothetical protein